MSLAGKTVRDPATVAEFLRKFIGPDPDRVETEYAKLRLRMIHYFGARRCPYPDELADEVIARAWRKFSAGAEIPHPTRYCYGIASNLYNEKRKKRKEAEIAFDPVAPGASTPGRQGFEERVLLVKECLAMVSERDRDLLRVYYGGDRKELATRLNLTPNALRLRVFHALAQIRSKIGERNSDR